MAPINPSFVQSKSCSSHHHYHHRIIRNPLFLRATEFRTSLAYSARTAFIHRSPFTSTLCKHYGRNDDGCRRIFWFLTYTFDTRLPVRVSGFFARYSSASRHILAHEIRLPRMGAMAFVATLACLIYCIIWFTIIGMVIMGGGCISGVGCRS